MISQEVGDFVLVINQNGKKFRGEIWRGRGGRSLKILSWQTTIEEALEDAKDALLKIQSDPTLRELR